MRKNIDRLLKVTVKGWHKSEEYYIKNLSYNFKNLKL